MKRLAIFLICIPGFWIISACGLLIPNPICNAWPDNYHPNCYGWPYNTKPHSYGAALGDLDGDGDPDAFLANGENEGGVKDTVWINDGQGDFTQFISQTFEMEKPFVSLGDLDQDGDLDAMLGGGAAIAALNDGQGHFSYPRPFLVTDDSGSWFLYPALGDLDGDGDLDVALGGCCGGKTDPPPQGQTGIRYSYNMVWLNDGHGRFTNTGQRLGIFGTGGLALGDLDSDGDLDIFDANSGSIVEGSSEPGDNQPDIVWLNDGHGYFADSGQRIGQEDSYTVALGDVDGDGDLDALVGNQASNFVWLNDGAAHFTDSGLRLGNRQTRLALFSDLDRDGDLDAFTSGHGNLNLWINQGGAQDGKAGMFKHSKQISYSIWYASTLGDVDGDGAPDIFIGLLDRDTQVWLNDGAGNFKEKLR